MTIICNVWHCILLSSSMGMTFSMTEVWHSGNVIPLLSKLCWLKAPNFNRGRHDVAFLRSIWNPASSTWVRRSDGAMLPVGVGDPLVIRRHGKAWWARSSHRYTLSIFHLRDTTAVVSSCHLRPTPACAVAGRPFMARWSLNNNI